MIPIMCGQFTNTHTQTKHPSGCTDSTTFKNEQQQVNINKTNDSK